MLCLRVWHLSVRLLVYAGLSLFIIGGSYVIWLYAYFTRITLHGGPAKWQKRGRAKWVLSCFCRHGEESLGHFHKVAPLSLNCFGRFSICNSALFIHSLCQTGSQPMSGR